MDSGIDGPSDGPTDRWNDKASDKVASPHLKTSDLLILNNVHYVKDLELESDKQLFQ